MDEMMLRGENQMLKEVGALFAAARQSSGLSLKAIAGATRISPSHILRMEGGKQDFTVTKYCRLCDAMGIPSGLALEAALLHTREFFLQDKNPYSESAQLAMKFIGGLSNSTGTVDGAKLTQQIRYSEIIEWLLVTTCRIAAALLLSSNPVLLARHVRCPFDPVREKLMTFAGTLDPLVSITERHGIIKSLKARPYFKLNSLGILDERIVFEYIVSDAYMTSVEPGFNIAKFLLSEPDRDGDKQVLLDTPRRQENNRDVKPKAPQIESLPDLLTAVHARVKERGQKAALARAMKVSRQAVEQWLSGDAKPSAELTFKLLKWVRES